MLSEGRDMPSKQNFKQRNSTFGANFDNCHFFLYHRTKF